MKRNLKTNKAIQYLGIFLVSIIAFTSIAATFPTDASSKSVTDAATSKYIVAQSNSQISDEEKIKTTIDAYFTTRYEGQKMLEAQDFSVLLADKDLPWVQKEKDKREIELYTAKLFDLRYVKYNYTLDYASIEIKNNKAVVNLKENHEVVFEAIAPDVSKLFNLKHVLTLHKKNEMWLIYNDEYQDELSVQLDHMTKNEIKDQVDKSYQDDLKKKTKSANSSSKVFAKPLLSVLELNTYTYNRTAAKNYADTYANGTNSDYDRYSPSDCTNFVSQAIYSGMGYASPNTDGMGTYGDDSEWYFDFYSKTGSSPWVGVPQQYDFITGNTSQKGPYGQENTLCATKVGDIIQLKSGGSWFHEAIVVSSVYPYCGTLSQYQIDSHTTDHYHYPLSNWASFYPSNMRSILILGWIGD